MYIIILIKNNFTQAGGLLELYTCTNFEISIHCIRLSYIPHSMTIHAVICVVIVCLMPTPSGCRNYLLNKRNPWSKSYMYHGGISTQIAHHVCLYLRDLCWGLHNL